MSSDLGHSWDQAFPVTVGEFQEWDPSLTGDRDMFLKPSAAFTSYQRLKCLFLLLHVSETGVWTMEQSSVRETWQTVIRGFGFCPHSSSFDGFQPGTGEGKRVALAVLQ